MRTGKGAVVLAILASLLVSCTVTLPVGPSDQIPQQAAIADTFFTGCAYLDQDGNQLVDPADPVLGGPTYTFTLAGGAGFGAETTDDQCGVATVPAALSPEAWPVVARIEAPRDFGFKAIGPQELTLKYPETRAEFLFIPE